MSKIIDKLLDYNTELSNDDRLEAAERIADLQGSLNNCTTEKASLKQDRTDLMLKSGSTAS